MATTSPGYSVTVRAKAPSTIGATADLAAAVMAAGNSLTALDVLESGPDLIVVEPATPSGGLRRPLPGGYSVL